MATTSLQNLKVSLIDYSSYIAKSNTTGNSTYSQIADDIYAEKIQPFVKNIAITTWEADIQKRIIDNPYSKIILSEKQAYCLARAYQLLNPETINA